MTLEEFAQTQFWREWARKDRRTPLNADQLKLAMHSAYRSGVHDGKCRTISALSRLVDRELGIIE